MAEEKNILFGEEFDQQQEFTLIDDGDYEVAIDKIEKRTSKAGNQCLNFTFVIRKDVDQKFQGRKLFYTVTKKADDTFGVYDYNRINKLILTQKDKPNYKKAFADADANAAHKQKKTNLNFIIKDSLSFLRIKKKG